MQRVHRRQDNSQSWSARRRQRKILNCLLAHESRRVRFFQDRDTPKTSSGRSVDHEGAVIRPHQTSRVQKPLPPQYHPVCGGGGRRHPPGSGGCSGAATPTRQWRLLRGGSGLGQGSRLLLMTAAEATFCISPGGSRTASADTGTLQLSGAVGIRVETTSDCLPSGRDTDWHSQRDRL